MNSTPNEIVSIRTFPFPIKLVFRAWSEPEHLKNWWGPKGFTNTFHHYDFREGGRWTFTMHGPEKGHYPNDVEFTSINEPFLIEWKRLSKPLFNVLATFEEITSDSTRIVFRQIFETAEECNKIKPFAISKNEENFDRLEEELKKMINLS